MPKRSGLGQRGLDLLIPVSGRTGGTDSQGEEGKTEKGSSSVKKTSSSGTAGKKPQAKKTVKTNITAGTETSSGKKMTASGQSTEKKTTASGQSSGKKTAASSQSTGKKTTASGQSTGKKMVASGQSSDKKLAAGTAAAKKTTVSRTAAGKKVDEAKLTPDAANSGPVMVPLSKVEPNREQPRKNFDEDALQELAESIRQHGIIQPLIVQERDGYYEIIAGERRWRAARIASLKEVPVIIREYTPREVMEISLIENIQREDLNPIEEAAAFRRLMEEYQLKQDEVAERVSKSRAAIANSVRLLNLDARVQDMVISEMLSTGHARALLAITDPEQQYSIAQRVFDEKLTVRDVEKLVRKMNEAPVSPVKRKISEALEAVYADLAEQMKSSLGTKVSIAPRSAQKGKIEIEYYSSDELDRLCTLLNSISPGEGV